MEIYTIGFTQTSAEHFFRRLADAEVARLLDVRLNNSSQLAGFAKAQDLPYFLRELTGAEYKHEPVLAPTQTLLDDYKKRKGTWAAYEEAFVALMAERRVPRIGPCRQVTSRYGQRFCVAKRARTIAIAVSSASTSPATGRVYERFTSDANRRQSPDANDHPAHLVLPE